MTGQRVTGRVMGVAACEECEDVCDCVVGSCIGCVVDQPQCQPCEDRCDCDPSQCLVAPVLRLASCFCPSDTASVHSGWVHDHKDAFQ